jgi:hypothetical protein
MDGVNVWILFKVAFIMPLSALYAWYLTRLMQKYRVEPGVSAGSAPASEPIAPRKAEPGTGFARLERRAVAPSR